MYTRTAFTLSTLGLLFGLAAPAAAKPIHLEVGPFIGYYLFSEDQDLGAYEKDETIPPTQWPKNTLTIGGRAGLYYLEWVGLEGELGYVPSKTNDKEADAGILNYGFQGVFNIPLSGYLGASKLAQLTPFVLVGYRQMKVSSDEAKDGGIGEDTDPVFQLGIGAKYYFSNYFGLRLDLRYLLTDGIGPDKDGSGKFNANNFEFTLSPFFLVGRTIDDDVDKDTVKNEVDQCPEVAGPPENNGCPDTDADRDGIVDRLDRCKDQPGVAETGGCPDPDTDGDGIVDRLDGCAQAAGPKENNGCPDTDRDGDGIVDRLDKCVDVKGVPEQGGCPWPDTDGDKFTDNIDKCVQQPESWNGYQDDDGCPDEVPQAVQKFTGVLKGIQFATGSAQIMPASKKILDEAAKMMTDYPDVKVEIQGHTDDQGKLDYNMTLSQKRADSVREYLLTKGIAAERLRAVGYGPNKPKADNKTPAGRAENRRMEFQLISEQR